MSVIKIVRGSSASFIDDAYEATLRGDLYGWLFNEAPAGQVDFQTEVVRGKQFVRGSVRVERRHGKTVRHVSVDLLPTEARTWYWHWVTREQSPEEKRRLKEEDERIERERRYATE